MSKNEKHETITLHLFKKSLFSTANKSYAESCKKVRRFCHITSCKNTCLKRMRLYDDSMASLINMHIGIQ